MLKGESGVVSQDSRFPSGRRFSRWNHGESKSGTNEPLPSSSKVSRPATIKRTATTKRAQPGKLIPLYFLKSHAVAGQADRPENRANQPLVGGHGPKVMISPRPPIPARSDQPQAAIKPSQRRRVTSDM